MDGALEHYGRKGMKWYQNIFTSEKTSGGPISTKTIIRAPGDNRSDPKKISDQELRQMVDRLNMEKRYRDLVKELNPERKSVAMGLLKQAGGKLKDKIVEKSMEKLAQVIVDKVTKKKGS